MDENKSNISYSEYSTTWLEDGLVYQKMNDGIKSINLKIATTLVDERKSVVLGMDYPVIFIANQALNVEDDAKGFYKTEIPYNGIILLAVIVKNHIAQYVGNIVLKFTKSYVPTEFFSNIEDAKSWVSKKIPVY